VILLILGGAGMGIFAAVSVLQTKEDIAESEVTMQTVPTFITTDAHVGVPLGADRSLFYDALLHALETGTVPITQLYATYSDGSADVPASTERILSLLRWRTPSSFMRALGTHSMFGAIHNEKTAPFIILQSTNFDVAFAGMLSWEAYLSEDLAPFFGTPFTTGHFVDALRSNRSIRILKDDTGNERIVYAFVNKNLIVITTSTEALASIIERVK
jgi:hypothetical protein